MEKDQAQVDFGTFMENVTVRLDALEDLFREKILYDENKESLLDKLYQDLQANRLDVVENNFRSLYKELFLLHDNLHREIAKFSNPENQTAKASLEFIAKEFLEILARRDVEIMPREEYFCDRQKQKVVCTEATSILEEDGKVVEVLQDGFIHRERVLRAQSIVIKKYEPQEVLENGYTSRD